MNRLISIVFTLTAVTFGTWLAWMASLPMTDEATPGQTRPDYRAKAKPAHTNRISRTEDHPMSSGELSLPSTNYYADPSRLQTPADRSDALYVEPDFRFTTHETRSVDVHITNDLGNPVAVRFSLQGLRPGDDPQLPGQSLLTGKTNARGSWRGHIELPPHFDRVVVIAQLFGIDNRQVAPALEHGDALSFSMGPERR